MLSNLISVIRTLTILPIPGKDTRNFPSCLPYFPLGGVVLAFLAYGVFKLMQIIPDIPLFSGIILTSAMLFFTGVLHLDGLADVADGFAGGKSKERILEIFKDSRLGTFGVTVLVIDVLLKIVMYTWYIEKKFFLIIAISFVASRSFQALSLAFLPSATPGRGIAASFGNGKHKFPVIISFLVLLILSFLFINWTVVLFLLCMILLFLAGFVYYCIKKIGGITGDCIGAINEISEIVILITGSFLIKVNSTSSILNLFK